MTTLDAEDVVTVETWQPRRDLMLPAWLTRQLPPRDYLLGHVLCSTSRWLIFGETGVGKTLFSLSMAGAVASGKPFLNWDGRRPARVMYLDGELPAETFKERMALVARDYGGDLPLFGYNRDVLGDGEMPPLNSDEGQNWLRREIDLIKPDAIFLDSIMSLLAGVMAEEESWIPVKPLVVELSARRIAQMWLHHTGHDNSRAYGTKTREWTLDTVLGLSREDEASEAIRLEFRKARLRTPDTTDEFRPRIVRCAATGWVVEGAAPKQAKEATDVEIVMRAILDAYDRLADGVTPSPGFNRALVRKVRVDALRDEVRSRGYLDTSDSGTITATSRSHFLRAKSKLLAATKLVEKEGLIWRP